MIKRNWIVTIVFLCLSFSATSGQNLSLKDSLIQLIEISHTPMEKAIKMIELTVDSPFLQEKKDSLILEELIQHFFTDTTNPSVAEIKSVFKFFYLEQHHKNEASINHGLAILKELSNKKDTSSTFIVYTSLIKLTLGHSYLKISQPNEAIAYYQEILTATTNRRLLGLTYNALGSLYEDYSNDISLAILYLEKALAIAKQLNNQVGIIAISNNLSYIYAAQGAIEKSQAFNQEIIALAKGTPYEIEMLIECNWIMVLAYFATKQYKQAKTYYFKTIELAKKEGYTINYVTFKSMVGKIELAEQRFEQAETQFEQVLTLINEKEYTKDLYELYENLGETKLALNKKSDAVQFFQKALITKDSFYNNLQVKNILNFEIQHRLKKYELEKVFAKKQQSLQQAVINVQNRNFWMLIVFFLVSLIGSLIFWYQRNDIRKAYYLLVAKNRALIKEYKYRVQQLQLSLANKLDSEKQVKAAKHSFDIDLKNKIISIFLKDKPFLDTGFTLGKLADLLESNTAYVSKAINEGFQMNFNSLINEYRIKELLLLLENKEHEKYTLDALSQKIGFKSRATFRAAFKKYTGVTPSYYIKQLSNS